MESQTSQLIRDEVVRGGAQWSSIIGNPSVKSPFRSYQHVILVTFLIFTLGALLRVFFHEDQYTTTVKASILTSAHLPRITEKFSAAQSGENESDGQLILLSVAMPISVSQRIHPGIRVSLRARSVAATAHIAIDGLLVGATSEKTMNNEESPIRYPRTVFRSIVISATAQTRISHSKLLALEHTAIKATFYLN